MDKSEPIDRGTTRSVKEAMSATLLAAFKPHFAGIKTKEQNYRVLLRNRA